MAAVTIIVVEFSARSLLRVKAQFGVGAAALNVAGGEREQRQGRQRNAINPSQEVHHCGIDGKGCLKGRIIRES